MVTFTKNSTPKTSTSDSWRVNGRNGIYAGEIRFHAGVFVFYPNKLMPSGLLADTLRDISIFIYERNRELLFGQ